MVFHLFVQLILNKIKQVKLTPNKKGGTVLSYLSYFINEMKGIVICTFKKCFITKSTPLINKLHDLIITANAAVRLSAEFSTCLLLVLILNTYFN